MTAHLVTVNTYKQKFDEKNITDASIFLTSLVPLRPYPKSNKESVTYWQNEKPSSTRFCRPVQFQFTKETTEITKNEISRMESEIANLNESIVCIKGKTFKINHELHFTMIDGKIAQTVTNTSSNAVCFICKVKPSEMNDLDRVRSKTGRICLQGRLVAITCKDQVYGVHFTYRIQQKF